MGTKHPLTSGERSPHTDPSLDPSARKIPGAVVKRLSLYSRALQTLERDKVEKVSSTSLGQMLGINSAQVRKDLAHFGQFGVPGFGYPVAELRRRIREILGTDKESRVVLTGAGNLGRALLSYGGFQREGFRIVCAFDKNVEAGQANDGEVPIYHIDQMEERIVQLGVNMAILAVPAEAAQETAERLARSGVTAILNFVPVRLTVPESVKVQYVDLALEMESLSFYVR